MYHLRNIVILIVLVMLAPALYAGDTAELENRVKSYFNDVALRVKQTEDPHEKRAILNTSFEKMFKATQKIQKMAGVSQADREAVAAFETLVQEKYDELNGYSGYDRIADDELDAFADYVRQDMEQADRTITISLTTLLIIIIIVLLLN